MPPTSEAEFADVNVGVGPGPYSESEDYTPNPTDVMGTVDTTGTAGAADNRIEEVSPIFLVADRKTAVNAARAIDPNDPGVSESIVVLPDQTPDVKEIKERLRTKARKAAKPTQMGEMTPTQEQATQTQDEGQGTGGNRDNQPRGSGEEPVRGGEEPARGRPRSSSRS